MTLNTNMNILKLTTENANTSEMQFCLAKYISAYDLNTITNSLTLSIRNTNTTCGTDSNSGESTKLLS